MGTPSSSKPLCFNLTQEGERLCRAKNYKKGIEYLNRALEIGTDDFGLLSAIYCQLGNAHVLLGDYETALQYHTYDVLVERMIENKVGEAKSCANLGNIFKMKGSYEEAFTFTFRQLEIAKRLNDEMLLARGHYNLGHIFLERGRAGKKVLNKESSEREISAVHEDLRVSIQYFKTNIDFAEKLNDSLSIGRSYGSIGNAYYCLADYDNSILFHKKRLEIAEEFGDWVVARRAHSNIGNCYALKADMITAIQHYREALSLAMELKEPAVEAQVTFAIANSLLIAGKTESAVQVFVRHLELARNLEDDVGQLRTCSELAQSYTNLKKYRIAVYFLLAARKLAIKVFDKEALKEGKQLLYQILVAAKTVVCPDSDVELLYDSTADPNPYTITLHEATTTYFETPLAAPCTHLELGEQPPKKIIKQPSITEDNEDLFDLIARLQSKRMDDQRVDAVNLTIPSPGPRQTDAVPEDDGPDALIELLINAQGRRMEDQRAALLPGLNETGQSVIERLNKPGEELDNHLVEWLMRVQSERLDEQRSELPPAAPKDNEDDKDRKKSKKEEEEVTELVMRMQAGRMEEQRAHLQPSTN